jgi:ABC-type phosphate transport system substrate-binding protein
MKASATLSFFTLLTALLLAGPAAADSPNDILVIANNSVPVDSLSAAEVKAFFLKKRKHWSGGGKAIPIHAPAGSSLRNAFVQRALGMTPAEELSYWQDQQIRRGISGPTEFSNTLKAVFRAGGAVSYVFRSDFRQGAAKVLAVLPG